MQLPRPVLDLVSTLEVHLDPIREMGRGPAGLRRIIPIVGGTVTGPRLNGRILNVGADWQTVYADGLADLDTRYAMETHDGATIEIRNVGVRHGPRAVLEAVARGDAVDPASYYMRTHARLETGDPRYAWVNECLFLGVGARYDASVRLDLYRIG